MRQIGCRASRRNTTAIAALVAAFIAGLWLSVASSASAAPRAGDGCVQTTYTDAADRTSAGHGEKDSASVHIDVNSAGGGKDGWIVTAKSGWTLQSVSGSEQDDTQTPPSNKPISGASGLTDAGYYVFDLNATACPEAVTTTTAGPTTTQPTTTTAAAAVRSTKLARTGNGIAIEAIAAGLLIALGLVMLSRGRTLGAAHRIRR